MAIWVKKNWITNQSIHQLQNLKQFYDNKEIGL